MPLNYLNGTISSVTLFNQTLPLNPVLSNYHGETLYISAASLDASGTLVVTIDDSGPPTAISFAAAAFTVAKARISLNLGAFSTTGPTATPVTYGGGPLVLTGTASLPAAGKYAGVDIAPTVSEWTRPLAKTRGLEFIVVQQSHTKPAVGAATSTNEVRWFSMPVDASAVPTTSDVVLNPPLAGVQGPFGLESPSP